MLKFSRERFDKNYGFTIQLNIIKRQKKKLMEITLNVLGMSTDDLRSKYKKEIEGIEDEIKRIDDILKERTKELTEIIIKNKKKK